MSSIATNLESVRAKIHATARRPGRDPGAVRLILATKTVEPVLVCEVIDAGQHNPGENKVQEGCRKAEALAEAKIRWSMIGHLQSNKVKAVLHFSEEVQSLDRLSLAIELEKRLQHLGRGLDVLVQVNTSGEVSKYGVAPEEVGRFLKELSAFDAIRIGGS